MGDSNSDKEPDTLGPLPIHPWNSQFAASNFGSSVDPSANPCHAPPNLTVSSKPQGPGGNEPPYVPVNYRPNPYDAISGQHSDVDGKCCFMTSLSFLANLSLDKFAFFITSSLQMHILL